MERSTIFNGKSTISMAIFNSYVSVPEGMLYSRLLDCEHPEADLEIRDAGRDDDRLTER